MEELMKLLSDPKVKDHLSLLNMIRERLENDLHKVNQMIKVAEQEKRQIHY